MQPKNLLEELMESLRVLPGVGPKTAQRMAFHLLEREREAALTLATKIQESVTRIGHCQRCRTFTEEEVDLLVLEQSASYRGYYFVLMGRLSPLDGIGPEALGMDHLEVILDEGNIKEIILATNSTVEGEVTAHYISEMAAARSISTSRIAQGIPMGGELEYVDRQTLAHAIEGRTTY